jgi:plasmid stabilization system protein ParE
VSPPLDIEVSELAAIQIRAADDWWRLNRSKAPNATHEEVERAARLISRQPQIVRPQRCSSQCSALASGADRFDLYYRVVSEPERIEVLTLWHSSRETGPPQLG